MNGNKRDEMLRTIWLVHPDESMCAAFRERFDGLPGAIVVQSRFEDLPPHDCFVTAGNAFGLMTAGIDAAVVRFFGEELMERVQFRIMDEYLGEQPVGTAFLMETGHSVVPFVVHAPTMRVPGNIEGTAMSTVRHGQRCWRSTRTICPRSARSKPRHFRRWAPASAA